MIANASFPKEPELAEKNEWRDTLKAQLQAEQAIKTKSGKENPQTFYFSVANLKRNQTKAAQNGQSVDNGKKAVNID